MIVESMSVLLFTKGDNWEMEWVRIFDFFHQLAEETSLTGCNRDGHHSYEELLALCGVYNFFERHGFGWENGMTVAWERFQEQVHGAPISWRQIWEANAKAGRPTSSSPSPITTPQRAFLELPPEETPKKIPHPLKKVQLTANKKLQQKGYSQDFSRKSWSGTREAQDKEGFRRLWEKGEEHQGNFR